MQFKILELSLIKKKEKGNSQKNFAFFFSDPYNWVDKSSTLWEKSHNTSNNKNCMVEVCTGRIFQTGPGPRKRKKISARKRNWNLGPSPARPGPKGKMKFRPEPDPTWNEIQNFGPGPARPGECFFFRFRPRQLSLSDFETSPFSCLHILNVFFCWWFFFPQIIKTTDFVLIAFS